MRTDPGAASRDEVAAGGVVFRPHAGGGFEIVVGEQRDRQTGEATVRLPKGKLEPGETVRDAAVREVAEETGLQVRLLEPLGEGVAYRYVDRRRGVTVSKRVHFFLMEHAASEAVPADDEMERVLWCRPEEALQRLTFQTERDIVRLARERLEERTREGA
jgi:8-oxo-dGTP pyrophosphatase MutT (NUDIX family)